MYSMKLLAVLLLAGCASATDPECAGGTQVGLLCFDKPIIDLFETALLNKAGGIDCTHSDCTEPAAHCADTWSQGAATGRVTTQAELQAYLDTGLGVPALHGICSVLPVGAKWPGVVSVQSLARVRLVALEYEPSLHGSGALAPSGQNEPGLQAAHACSPSSSWKVPAAH